jgi:hypothetical protein
MLNTLALSVAAGRPPTAAGDRGMQLAFPRTNAQTNVSASFLFANVIVADSRESKRETLQNAAETGRCSSCITFYLHEGRSLGHAVPHYCRRLSKKVAHREENQEEGQEEYGYQETRVPESSTESAAITASLALGSSRRTKGPHQMRVGGGNEELAPVSLRSCTSMFLLNVAPL